MQPQRVKHMQASVQDILLTPYADSKNSIRRFGSLQVSIPLCWFSTTANVLLCSPPQSQLHIARQNHL